MVISSTLIIVTSVIISFIIISIGMRAMIMVIMIHQQGLSSQGSL